MGFFFRHQITNNKNLHLINLPLFWKDESFISNTDSCNPAVQLFLKPWDTGTIVYCLCCNICDYWWLCIFLYNLKCCVQQHGYYKLIQFVIERKCFGLCGYPSPKQFIFIVWYYHITKFIVKPMKVISLKIAANLQGNASL